MPSEHECDKIMERLSEQDQKFSQQEEHFDGKLSAVQRDMHNHIREVRIDLSDHIAEQAARHNELLDSQRQNTEAITALTRSTEGLIEAWNTANGVAKFIKWASGIIAAVVAAWTYFKQGV